MVQATRPAKSSSSPRSARAAAPRDAVATASATPGAQTATVASVGTGGRVTVQPGEGAAHSAAVGARLAVPAPYAPRVGDVVLTIAGARGECYVVGVLSALREAGRPGDALATREGASAALVREEGGEVLLVRDAGGRILFEHRPAEGRSVLHAPEGDLELRADRGAIRLESAGDVSVRAAGVLEVEGARGARLAAGASEAGAGASVALDARRARVTAPALEARAERGEFAFDEARLLARAVSSAVETAHHVAHTVESRVTQLVERARNTYREVEELAQTRAGRVRWIARTTLHAVGRRTLIKADEDVKLKGETIHLA